VDGAIERRLFCCPALWSRTAAARLKLASRHAGGEIGDVYYSTHLQFHKDYKYLHYSKIENWGYVLYTGARYIRDFTVHNKTLHKITRLLWCITFTK